MKLKVRRFLSICLLIGLGAAFGAKADQPQTILILPFSIHAEKDLTYLRNGINDMLLSRLNIEGQAIPVLAESLSESVPAPTGPITEAAAAAIGEKAGMDFVVFGSLTVFGESLSTDARLYQVSQRKTLVSFHRSGTQTGDLINHVNLFAQRIRDQVFEPKRESQPLVSAEEMEKRKDPSLMWQPDAAPGTAPSKPGKTGLVTGAAALPSAVRILAEGLRKTEPFKGQINGISAGDVDGDGRQELAMIIKNSLILYRFESGVPKKIGEFKEKANAELIGVDVADINADGKAEIFVTCLSTEGKLRSFVLGWNGKQLAKIADHKPYFFRVISLPESGPTLIGQKKGVRKPFGHEIFQFAWKNGEYQPGPALNSPNWANVFGVAVGRIQRSDIVSTIAYLPNDHLTLLDAGGDQLWKSDVPYGGQDLFIEYPAEIGSGPREDRNLKRIYVQQRIIPISMAADGKMALLVCRNEDKTKRAFSRLRMYDGGYLECLSWENGALRPQWKTREFEGYISDLGVADLDHDGQVELFCSVVSKKTSWTGAKTSYIVILENDPTAQGD